MNPNDIKLNPEQQKIVDAGNVAGRESSKITGVSYSPIVPATISSSTLANNPQPYNLPPTESSTSVANKIVGQSSAYSELFKAQQEKEEKLTAEREKAKTGLEDVVNKITGVQSSRASLEEDAGTALLKETARKSAKDLNVSQRGQQNELKALEGAGLTDVQRQQKANEINRRYAFEQADLMLTNHLATSDYNAAISTINDKIKLELEPLQTKYNYLTGVYDELKGDLTKAEDRSFQLQVKEVEDAQKLIEDKGKAVQSIFSTALQNSVQIPPNVALQISNAKSAEEVYQLASNAGISLQDPLERDIKKAQLSNLKASGYTESLQQRKLLKELNNSGDSASDSDLQAYASQYADTGKLPSPAELKLSGLNVGQVTAFAKQLPKPIGALVSTNTGIKSSSLSAKEEEGITALNEIVNTTLPDLKDRFGKISTGILGGIGGKIYTSQDRQDYLSFRAEFLSKLLVARSGAAVTEQEYARYAKLLPSTFNQAFFLGSDGLKKLNALETSMKGNLDNNLNSRQLSIYGYSKTKVGDKERTVGEIIDIGGTQYKVLPDGTLTDII
jgi:hypothetical protein